MKKIYAFMAVASLALSASAAPHFSDLFAKDAEGKVNNLTEQTFNIVDGSAMDFKMNTIKNQIKTHRTSRAEEAVCPEIAPLQRMLATFSDGDLVRNFFNVEQTGDTTVTITNWFNIFSDAEALPITATYKYVTYENSDGSTVDMPTLTIKEGTPVIRTDTGKEYYLWFFSDGVWAELDVDFIVDDFGNLIPLYTKATGFFLGYAEGTGFRGMSFADAELTGIRGIQEAKLAALNGDSNGFDFTNAGIDENGEEYPFSWNINYVHVENEEENTIYVTSFGMSDYLAPFTLEGEDVFVDGAYYMYDLVNNTGEVEDKAFMVTGTLDGLEFQAVGGGCVGFIDYSVADTAVITVEGIWGGVTDEEDFGLMPVQIGEGLYSLFSDSKVELWGFSNPNSGISAVGKDENTNAPVEYYNLQGMKVANPAAGQVVIKKQGNKTSKIFIR